MRELCPDAKLIVHTSSGFVAQRAGVVDLGADVVVQKVSVPLVDVIELVADAQILAGMAFLFDRMKLVAEPSGASALAALLAGRIEAPGARVGVVISGGNVGVARFCELLGRPAA